VTKEFIFRQLDTLSVDGLVEVAQFIEFLQFRGQALHPSASGEHTAFGRIIPKRKTLSLLR